MNVAWRALSQSLVVSDGAGSGDEIVVMMLRARGGVGVLRAPAEGDEDIVVATGARWSAAVGMDVGVS